MTDQRKAPRFEVLGPVRAWRGAVEVQGLAPKPLAVLATLLANANHVVTAQEIIDTLWATPPATAANAVQTYVSQLRRALHNPDIQVIDSVAGGYRITISPDGLDLLQFDNGLARARQFRAAGDLAAADEAYTAALQLWHGTPFSGIAADGEELLRHPISERHAATVEEAAEIRIALGGPFGDLITLLTVATERYPDRERLWKHLMTALYRSGRQAEALAAYRTLRDHLDSEHGVPPSQAMSDLVQAILKQDPSVGEPVNVASWPVVTPAQLPPDVAGFSGRSAELAQMNSLLEDVATNQQSIFTITGTAGVGKTTLAVHWAYHAQPLFPDGCLYVDMQGFGPDQPAAAGEALGGFLRALGIEGPKIPKDRAERAAAFRSLTANLRLLVIIDNASTAEQIQDLLPGRGRTVTIVTSRNDLSALSVRYGARTIDLQLLTADQSLAFLRARIGARIDTDLQAATELADRCAHLPLALAIGAELVRKRQATGLRELLDEMFDEHRRLDLLEIGNDPHLAIRVVLSWSYRHLSATAARTFRLSGLPAGTHLSAEAVAALTDTDLRRARQAADELTNAKLWTTTRHGFHMHELLRIYARELAQAEESERQRHAAVHQLLLYLLHSAVAAEAQLTAAPRRLTLEPLPGPQTPPEFPDADAALEWFEAERPNLVAAAQQAFDIHLLTIAWQLPATLGLFFYIRKYWNDWLTTHATALAAAQQIPDPLGIARIATNLGNAHYDMQDFRQAIANHEIALTIRRDLQDPSGMAVSLMNIAEASRGLQQYDRAVAMFLEALEMFRQVHDQYGEAMTLSNLANVYLEQDQLDSALSYGIAALAIRRTLKDAHGLSFTLNCLGDIYRGLHRYDEALAALQEARQIRRRYFDEHGEAMTLCSLAEVSYETGRTIEARTLWATAIAILDRVDQDRAAAIRQRLSQL